MSADFSTIKAGIKAILQADTDLANGAVYDYEPTMSEVEKDPFAIVTASDNQSEYESTSENMRTYGFVIRILVERNSRGGSNAETLLTNIVDRIVNAIDVNYTLGVSGVILTKATPSSWSYVISDKQYRVAEIRLSTMVSVDVTA